MADRPEPPEGYETWLDAALSGTYVVPESWQDRARAELEELREKAKLLDCYPSIRDARTHTLPGEYLGNPWTDRTKMPIALCDASMD